MTAATAFDRITDALRANQKIVKPTGPGKASAQCPAHEDRNPSLSVKRIEGQVLVCCHAGCDNLDVMAALGLSKSDFYDNPRGPTYTYDDGRSVHRTPDKRFRQSGNTNGQQTTLYRLGEIQKAVANDRLIFFVEGEKDVHAIESLGEIATTAPMGASNVDKCDLSPLHGGRVIVIVDRDQAGEDRARYIRGALKAKHRWSSHNPKSARMSPTTAAGYGLDELVPVADNKAQATADSSSYKQGEDRPRVDVRNDAHAAAWLRQELGRCELAGIFRRDNLLVHTPRIGLVHTPRIGEDGYLPPEDLGLIDAGPAQVRPITTAGVKALVETRHHCWRTITVREDGENGKKESVKKEVAALFPQ